jgi:hypothetical protein
LKKEDQQELYSSGVGSLHYLVNHSRPDLSKKTKDRVRKILDLKKKKKKKRRSNFGGFY